MRSEFSMSRLLVLEEAADWLAGLGCVVDKTSDGADHRLVVHHDDEMTEQVRQVVKLVDPASAEIG